MSHFLLLGAGFSKNWGGWLASEAFEYLLGHPEIISDKDLNQLLWNTASRGNFENTLAHLQASTDPKSADQLAKLQNAISDMFNDMNEGFAKKILELQNLSGQMMNFLTCFSAIFTLNQDLLLEMHYHHNNAMALASGGRWIGGGTPGMNHDNVRVVNPADYCKQKWGPHPELPTTIAPKNQPYFKLHGSSNWYDNSGKRLLITGGNKGQFIAAHEVLNWYQEQFKTYLQIPNSRLMIIGYSFSDNHINSIILNAVRNYGLKLFIIDPLGIGVISNNNPTKGGAIYAPTAEEEDLQKAVIGASRRTLKESFGGDVIEYQKIMRFFN